MIIKLSVVDNIMSIIYVFGVNNLSLFWLNNTIMITEQFFTHIIDTVEAQMRYDVEQSDSLSSVLKIEEVDFCTAFASANTFATTPMRSIKNTLCSHFFSIKL